MAKRRVQKQDERRDPTPDDLLGADGELGTTGLQIWGGRVDEEILRELSGGKAAKIYREMSLNDALVGAVLFAIRMLIRSVQWTVQRGGAQPIDEQAREFLQTCMEDMEHTWDEFVDEVLSMLVFGYALHEPVYKRRLGMHPPAGATPSMHDDGRIGWKKLPIRAQETVDRWLLDDSGDLVGIVQVAAPQYAQTEIPIERLLHFRPTAHKDNPEGQSILRTAYRAWWFKKHVENMEGIGIERDLVGIPVAKVPTRIMKPDASAADKQAFESIKKLVTQVKKNEQAGIVLPLEYDEKGNERFKFELLSVGGSRLYDTDAVIMRKNREIAMSVMADFILLGHEKVGSFALSDSKTNLFATAIGSWLSAIAEILNRTAVPRLMALNPEFEDAALPFFEHDDIETPDLAALGTYVGTLASAGAELFPDDELENFLRRAAGMPEIPEGDDDLDDEGGETEPPPDDENAPPPVTASRRRRKGIVRGIPRRGTLQRTP